MEIRYEDVVADLEGASRRVLSFLGVEWNQGVLRFDIHAKTKQLEGGNETAETVGAIRRKLPLAHDQRQVSRAAPEDTAIIGRPDAGARHRDQQNIQHSYPRDCHTPPWYLERVGQT